MSKKEQAQMMSTVTLITFVILNSAYVTPSFRLYGIFTDSRIFGVIPLGIFVIWIFANRKAIQNEYESRWDVILYNPWLTALLFIILIIWVIVETT